MTHLLHELQNTENLENIHEIQFSLFSHNDIERGSVADILTPDTYDSNIPKNNGLFDHNMGSIDASIICPTDEKKAELCPGYFGKIDLALPVFNHHFVGYVEKILKCVCFRCSNLLLDKSDPNVLKELEGKKGSSRFATCIALCAKNKKCSFNNGCFVLQPTKYVRLNGAASIKDKNNIIQIYAEFSQNSLKDSKVLKQQNFTPLICYQILKKIKDEDVAFIGLSTAYSRPEWMIIKSLAVPPPSVRPSVRQSDNQRSEDDLTYALCNIVKANKLLKQVLDNSNSDNKKIDNHQGYLQYLVSTYMDNEIPGVPQNAQRSSFRALKAITQRLKGKEGRLRGNIMGKRVDYSARTVISVDPNIDIDQYGVPMKIAMNLTFPEIITQYNMTKMKNMVRNGPKTYPGAKTVTKTGDSMNKSISLKHVDVQQIADNLQIGDIVHRHLLDGDVCLFNRQPTLHRMSMMTHKIKILPYSTFRLNVTVCKPYNADFDGDEMNMHIPQSLQTAVELEQICLVPQHIISPGTSTPCIEITQDTLLGAYLLTIKDAKIREDQMYNYMMFSKKFNGLLPEPAFYEDNIPYWNGKQLYSLILPDININQLKNIKIIRGKITEGYLNSDSLGGSSGGLIKQIYNAYGMETCNDFLNDTQKLITRWMTDNSFTIGFGDSTVNKEQRKIIREIINHYLEESFDLVRKAQHGVFANDLDDSYKADSLEFEMMKILSNLSEKVKDRVIELIPKSNNFYQAGDKASGSKGKAFNIQQIIGCVGQQDIWGSRIKDGFTERTLPHFARNDVGPDAKGFCRNSFIEGLNPSEMFFHAMGGRTGTIDTAIKSVTGNTPIIIMERGIVKHVNIGDWIDEILDSNKENVKNLPEKEMELLELDYEAHIPTTDLDGNVSWGIIKNITRHDPGKELYEIKTSAGKQVIVTESHSLLIWNGKQFERKSTPQVKIGDYVPVTMNLVDVPVTMNHVDVPVTNNDALDVSLELDYINPVVFGKDRVYISNLVDKIIEKFGKTENDVIEITHDSQRMLNDINFCLSRINIFGIINSNKLLFNRNKLINDYIQVNDTVLDAIIEINKVCISKYPKVYDLTIPSTLNFGLANGLHVVDTADSGYLSRKFIKASEDLVVNYDFAVRNASGHIVQFGYGDDNFDPIKLEKVTRIELIEYDNKKMESVYKFDSLEDTSYFENFMTPSAIKEMMDDINYKNVLNDEYQIMLDLRNELRYKYFKNTEAIGDINTYIPINLFRVIPSQKIKFNIQPFHFSDITPQYIIKTFNDTMKDIVKYLPEKEENWKLFKIIFRSFLSPKRVICEDRMNKAVFDSIILIIREKMMSSLVNAGEMVGIIGAQTLGEISTQLTLNTFHSAGVGAGSLVITEGIPRLREIINVSKNLKYKNMFIYLKEEYANSKDNAKKIQSRFAYTQLKDILEKSEILFDNKNGNTDKEEDIEFMKSYKEFSELFDNDNIDESCLSPWILRLTFDKESLMNRKITIQEVQETIKENFHNDQEIDCIYSDDSANNVVMRIRIKQDNKGSFLEFMKDFEKQLISLSLRGITNINQVEIAESNIIKYHDDGTFGATKEWVLKTNGSNLIDILGEESVDSSRTLTNDILEFFDIFGIEATRELIYRELSKVYSEKNPNPRHIQLMSDIMTYRGKLMQIDRHGLNKNSEIGPIAKASFEEVMNIFTKAALFAEKDNMKGVSANILAGQFCKSGTNFFDILIDEDKMEELVEIGDYVESEHVSINENNVNSAFSKAYNAYEPTETIKDSDFNFGFGIEEKEQYQLENINTSNVIIVDKKENTLLTKENTMITNEFNFNKMSIETPTYENVDTNGNDLNINFEQINIDQPSYELEEENENVKEEIDEDTDGKKSVKKIIKVKKVKEEKPKKEKVVKKKLKIDNEK